MNQFEQYQASRKALIAFCMTLVEEGEITFEGCVYPTDYARAKVYSFLLNQSQDRTAFLFDEILNEGAALTIITCLVQALDQPEEASFTFLRDIYVQRRLDDIYEDLKDEVRRGRIESARAVHVDAQIDEMKQEANNA